MIFISSFWYIVGSGLESLGELLCLVVGAFGEVSEDLERTIKAIAKSMETGQPAVSDNHGRWWQFHINRFFSIKVFGEKSRKGFL
jgi:hypothetical protein